MNGVTFAFLPLALARTFATSKPNSWLRFHDPWRATKMEFLYSFGNMSPV
ncbi:MAG: hypothetical protein ACRET6_09510 [Burkholderiales bacterium]